MGIRLRDPRLLEQVLAGELTIEEADALSEKRGFGPLLFLPDPAQHDVLGARSWTLTMALAWIIWRRSEPLLLCWPEFIEQAEAIEDLAAPTPDLPPLSLAALSPSRAPKRQLVRRKPLTFQQLTGVARQASPPDLFDHPKAVPVDSAKAQLLEALCTGQLPARGRLARTLDPVDPVRPSEFQELSIDSATVNGGKVIEVMRNRSGAAVYRELGIRPDVVLQLWPDASSSAPPAMRVEDRPKRSRHSAQRHLIHRAVYALWPEGIPETLMVKERVGEVEKWLASHGRPVPNADTIRKEIRSLIGITRR